MRRPLRLLTLLAALALQTLAPIAAYAFAPAAGGMADFCSASGNAPPVGTAPLRDAPGSAPSHVHAHCAYCPAAGTAAAAPPPAVLAPLVVARHVSSQPAATPPAVTVAPPRVPPSRAPPANLVVA